VNKLLGLLVLAMAFTLTMGTIGCNPPKKEEDKKEDKKKEDKKTEDKKEKDKKDGKEKDVKEKDAKEKDAKEKDKDAKEKKEKGAQAEDARFRDFASDLLWNRSGMTPVTIELVLEARRWRLMSGYSAA